MAKNIKSSSKGAGNLFFVQGNQPRFTGKRIVTMNKYAKPSGFQKLTKKAALNVASIHDFTPDNNPYHNAFQQADGIYFDSLKIAVINQNNEEQLNFMQVASIGTANSFTSEPERYVYALSQRSIPSKILKTASLPNNSDYTWGAQAIKLPASPFTGKGVNIAVLDTGLNLSHPDFADRTIQSKSFIKHQEVEDKNGHGTHCCGIAVGGINKKTLQRYGVAVGANLFAGKVLSNSGVGNDSDILAGIEWALQNNCKIISLSLGSAVEPGDSYSPAYERAAKTALGKGCLIVAAAGNESERQAGKIKPVGHPANCPSILAVAAIDEQLNIAYFSCGGFNIDGGQVDIAAPGVDIYSSWKGKKYSTLSGTSMATPFVAGVAALYFEANPKAKASDIWMMLSQNAMRLNLPSTDVGCGLVQAHIPDNVVTLV